MAISNILMHFQSYVKPILILITITCSTKIYQISGLSGTISNMTLMAIHLKLWDKLMDPTGLKDTIILYTY